MRENLLFTYDSLGQYVKSIDKGGVIYEKSSAITSTPVFLNETYKITQIQNGYLWEEKHGEWKLFGLDGKMTSFGNSNGALSNLIYDPGSSGKLTGTDSTGFCVFDPCQQMRMKTSY